MPKFDYSAPAEIFGTGRNARTRQRVAYRRFHSGAEAVRFAVEDIPAPLLVGVVLESDEDRFDHRGIRALYDSEQFPLARHAAAD
jgi:hypothetical protein